MHILIIMPRRRLSTRRCRKGKAGNCEATILTLRPVTNCGTRKSSVGPIISHNSQHSPREASRPPPYQDAVHTDYYVIS